MSQNISAVPMEANHFGELLERPGCYEFEPFDGGPRRLLSNLQSPPSLVDGTVMTGEKPEIQSSVVTGELELPDETDIPDLLRDFGKLAFQKLAGEAHNQGHKLLGGASTYETDRGPQTGLFISRRILLEMNFATLNAGLAPNKYPRYDVPPHPEYGRHAPPEVSALARMIPLRDQERTREISYALTRNSILEALKSEIANRKVAVQPVLELVAVRDPDPIAA